MSDAQRVSFTSGDSVLQHTELTYMSCRSLWNGSGTCDHTAAIGDAERGLEHMPMFPQELEIQPMSTPTSTLTMSTTAKRSASANTTACYET